MFPIGHDQHGFQLAKNPIHSPGLGKFDGSPMQLAMVFLQLFFKPLKKGKCIRCGSGKSGQDLAVVEASDLAGLVLENGLAQGDLAIRSHGHTIGTSNADYGCGVKFGRAHAVIVVAAGLRGQERRSGIRRTAPSG